MFYKGNHSKIFRKFNVLILVPNSILFLEKKISKFKFSKR